MLTLTLDCLARLVAMKVYTPVSLTITPVRLDITQVSLNITQVSVNNATGQPGDGNTIQLKSLQSAVCVLPSVCTLPPTHSLQSAF